MTSSFVLYGEPTYVDSHGRKEKNEKKCLWNTSPDQMTQLIPSQAETMKDKRFFVKVYEKHEVRIENGFAMILTKI